MDLTEKLLAISQAFQDAQIPYAFGGAIALAFYAEPRATSDLDINIFLAAEDKTPVLNALASLFPITDRAQIELALDRDAQARTDWAGNKVDLFFMNLDFHLSIAQRIHREPFQTTTIPIISAEDLIICKAVFNRPKDWVDIRSIFSTIGTHIDTGYLEAWLSHFFDQVDPRVGRMRKLFATLPNAD